MSEPPTVEDVEPRRRRREGRSWERAVVRPRRRRRRAAPARPGTPAPGRRRHRWTQGGAREAAPATLDAEQLQSWLLRAGLAFVFLYAAVSALFDSSRFTQYMPSYLPERLHRYCLPTFSAYEMLLVIGLLTGRHLFAVSMLSAMTVAAIVVVNPDSFEVLFRNVAIACAALSLAVHARALERRSAAQYVPTPVPSTPESIEVPGS